MAHAGLVLILAGLSACAPEAEAPAPTPPPPAPTPAPTPEAPPPDPDAVLLGAGPGDPAWDTARAGALDILGRVVDWEAGDPALPWALAHGLLARGPKFYARDGRLARDVLAADFLQWRQVGDRNLPFFPEKLGAARVEPHPGLMLKNLVEVGAVVDEPFAPRPGAPTVRSLTLSSMASHRPGPGAFWPDPDGAPWLAQAWCQVAAAGGPRTFTAADGREHSVKEAAETMLVLAERDTAFLREAMNAGAPVEKKKQGVFAYSCGGGHLIQGVVACAAAGFPEKKDSTRTRAAALVDTYLYRFPFEAALVERALAAQPKLATVLLNQDVKFLGHLLETAGKAKRDGIWTPTDSQRATLQQAESLLLRRVRMLERLGAYAVPTLSKLRAGGDKGPQPLDPYQHALDLVGDAAHALVGLELAAATRQP